MTTTIRLPLGQFEFIEQTFDRDMTPEGAVDEFRKLKNAYLNDLQEPAGLTAKELDLIIEKMCLGTSVEGGTELWSKATQAQKDQINCLKRALKRIEAKQGHNRDKEMYEGLDQSDTKND